MHAIFPEVWELERFPTAKFTSNVTQGYWYWCYSIGLTGYFISLPLQLYLYEYLCTVSYILSVIYRKPRDPEHILRDICDLWLDWRCALGRSRFGLGVGQRKVVHPTVKVKVTVQHVTQSRQ